MQVAALQQLHVIAVVQQTGEVQALPVELTSQFRQTVLLPAAAMARCPIAVSHPIVSSHHNLEMRKLPGIVAMQKQHIHGWLIPNGQNAFLC